MKAAVYCRVSTDDQADSRTIDNQVQFALKYCDLHGLEIYDYYLDDGVSGAVPVENRPAGRRMLDDARRGLFRAVYVYRLDRLARTALDILKTHQKLDEAGVVLRSMTESFDTSTPSGKFFMTTLGGIAEIERETIAERMRLGKDRALREGRWPGGPPPYGYTLADGRLSLKADEAQVVKKIFTLYAQGGMSTGTIADYLNACRVPAPGSSGKGRASNQYGWHGSRVWAILSNPAYRGRFLYRRAGGAVGLNCPPVVKEELWEAAAEIRGSNSMEARRCARREYLLRGIIKCGMCGRSYCGDGAGGTISYYRCSGSSSSRAGKERCGSRAVRAPEIEDIVWGDVCAFLYSGDILDLARPAALSRRPEDFSLETVAIESAIKDRERDCRRLISLFKKEIIGEEELRGELGGIRREIEALKARRSVLAGREEARGFRGEMRLLLEKRLESASCREKRQLVRALVETITVDTTDCQGKKAPRVKIYYNFEKPAGCAPVVETRGKYRLGVPKSPY